MTERWLKSQSDLELQISLHMKLAIGKYTCNTDNSLKWDFFLFTFLYVADPLLVLSLDSQA